MPSGYLPGCHECGCRESRSNTGVKNENTHRPLGVPNGEPYQEGALAFARGDTLVLFSDGLIDAKPELALTCRALAERLDGAGGACDMMDTLLVLPALEGPPPDDLTVLVIRCNSDLSQAK